MFSAKTTRTYLWKAEHVEAVSDRGARDLGGVALAPGECAEMVTDLDLWTVLKGAEQDRADKLVGVAYDNSPQAVWSILLVPLDALLNALARLLHRCVRLAAGEVAPNLRIPIDFEHGRGVVQPIPADDQTLRLEDGLCSNMRHHDANDIRFRRVTRDSGAGYPAPLV